MMLSPQTLDLARRLLACEAVAGKTSVPTESAAVRVCEKLRPPLCALAGVAGYRSLLSRALTLAQTKVPGLSAVQVAADGSLQGLGELEPQIDKGHAGEGEVILIAQLLGLFLAFIGEALTLRLVQDVSPHLKVTAKSSTPMPFENILQEVGQLNNVSERLESLADQHPFVEDALLSISGNIRSTATVLEVLALIRNKSIRLPKDAPKQPAERYKM
jgi:hypothetical protein